VQVGHDEILERADPGPVLPPEEVAEEIEEDEMRRINSSTIHQSSWTT
jgi:hypothetical protein